MRDGNATREQLRAETREAEARPAEGLHVQLQPSTKAFKLQLTFAKSKVERNEIIGALEAIIRELREAE